MAAIRRIAVALTRPIMSATARPALSFAGPSQLAVRSLSETVTQTFLPREEVTERTVAVVKQFEKVEEAKVTPSAHFGNDLGLDSLDTVELCMAIEEEFCIQIPDAEAEKIHSVTDAIEFVATHPQAK